MCFADVAKMFRCAKRVLEPVVRGQKRQAQADAKYLPCTQLTSTKVDIAALYRTAELVFWSVSLSFLNSTM